MWADGHIAPTGLVVHSFCSRPREQTSHKAHTGHCELRIGELYGGRVARVVIAQAANVKSGDLGLARPVGPVLREAAAHRTSAEPLNDRPRLARMLGEPGKRGRHLYGQRGRGGLAMIGRSDPDDVIDGRLFRCLILVGFRCVLFRQAVLDRLSYH